MARSNTPSVRRYQKKLKMSGRCVTCGKPRPAWLFNYCELHNEKHAERQRRRFGCAPWVPGKRGRPPAWFNPYVAAHGKPAALEEALRRNAAGDNP